MKKLFFPALLSMVKPLPLYPAARAAGEMLWKSAAILCELCRRELKGKCAADAYFTSGPYLARL